MKTQTVSVLGTDYEVCVGKREEIGLPKEFDGECRQFSHVVKVHHSFEGVEGMNERDQRTEETVAHEMFHAFVSESGLNIDENTEELLAQWYMKVWRKMNNCIMQVLDSCQILR